MFFTPAAFSFSGMGLIQDRVPGPRDPNMRGLRVRVPGPRDTVTHSSSMIKNPVFIVFTPVAFIFSGVNPDMLGPGTLGPKHV